MIKIYDPTDETKWLCHFGVTEAIGGILAGVGAAGAAAAPEAAAAIAPAVAGGAEALTLPAVDVIAAAPAAAAGVAPEAAAGAGLAAGGGALTAADVAGGAAATPTPPSGLDQALAGATPFLAPPTAPIGVPAVPPPTALPAVPPQPAGLANAIAPVSGTPGPGAGAASIAPPPSAPISPTSTGTIGPPPGVTDANAFSITDSPTSTADTTARNSALSRAIDNASGSAGFTVPGTDTTIPGAPLAESPGAAINETAAQQAASGTAAPQSSLSKFIENPTLGGFGDVVSNNAGFLIPAAGLGYQFLNQPKLPDPTKLTNNITAAANQFATQGQNLQQYLASGTLPPGVQSGINQAADSAKAAVRSRHAASGTSGSSAEFEEMNAIDTKAATEGSNLAFNLLQQGVSETGLSADIYKYLLQTTLAQDTALGNAIGNFSGALAGLSRGAQPTQQQTTA